MAKLAHRRSQSPLESRESAADNIARDAHLSPPVSATRPVSVFKATMGVHQAVRNPRPPKQPVLDTRYVRQQSPVRLTTLQANRAIPPDRRPQVSRDSAIVLSLSRRVLPDTCTGAPVISRPSGSRQVAARPRVRSVPDRRTPTPLPTRSRGLIPAHSPRHDPSTRHRFAPAHAGARAIFQHPTPTRGRAQFFNIPRPLGGARNFSTSHAHAAQKANPRLLTPPRDPSVPFPPEGVSASAAVSQQPWFDTLLRALVRAIKLAVSDSGREPVAVSSPLKRKRGISPVDLPPRPRLSPRRSLDKVPTPPQTFTPSPTEEEYPSSGESVGEDVFPIAPMEEVHPPPERSPRLEVEKDLPPSLLESCTPPRRESKDSKTIPKSSARIRQEQPRAVEDTHVSPQEEPLGSGDFAASPSGGERQESEHAFWQVLSLMRSLNGIPDPEVPPRDGQDTVLDRIFGTHKPSRASAALPWSQGMKSAREKIEGQLADLASSSRSSAG
ncbi:serine/arginine repetitive matrix protein 1-like [Palaemon carinicauda]|uniref:serine/arginine repetitive matrix protein 1-like n=1 Tax=Palaemon carinicauda TaxID=392227 RepID=UPI0035B576C2